MRLTYEIGHKLIDRYMLTGESPVSREKLAEIAQMLSAIAQRRMDQYDAIVAGRAADEMAADIALEQLGGLLAALGADLPEWQEPQE